MYILFYCLIWLPSCFYIARGIKCHDIYLIKCCLICLYVVLNLERFFLHVYVIPSIALFETSASERNAQPIPHVVRARAHTHTHTHTHSCLFFRLSERLVYNIPGCCKILYSVFFSCVHLIQKRAYCPLDIEHVIISIHNTSNTELVVVQS